MYKQIKDGFTGNLAQVVLRLSDNTFIPFDPANTDYQAFKQDLANGVELKDANNNVMTAEQANTFLATLP